MLVFKLCDVELFCCYQYRKLDISYDHQAGLSYIPFNRRYVLVEDFFSILVTRWLDNLLIL